MEVELDQDLSTWLEKFQNAGDRRDFPVLVEGVQLFVNKYALAAASPVFEKALFGDFKEAQENQLKLPDKKLNEVLKLFACLLTVEGHFRKQVNHTNFAVLWKLAEEYFIEVERNKAMICLLPMTIFQEVFLLCEAFVARQLDFKTRKTNLADLFKSGVVRHVFSVDRLEKFQISLKYLLVAASSRDLAEFYDDLPKEVLVEVLTTRDLSKEGEIKMHCCISCRADAMFVDRKKGVRWCLKCKKQC